MSQTANPPIVANALGGRNVLLLALLGVVGCIFGFAVLAELPDPMIGVETAQAIIASAVLMIMLIATLAARTRGIINVHQQVLLTAILLFSFLTVAERVFYRYSTVGAAFRGVFDPSAYAETMIWAVCFAVLMLVTFRNPGYVGRLLESRFRWMFLLALFSMASAAYSPAKAYSFAWGFKLILAVMLLRVVLDEIESMEDLRWFFWGALWSFGALVVLCLAQLAVTPDPWEGGRMAEELSPTGVSAIAATLFLLGLTFYVDKCKRKYLVLSGLGFCVMLLGGGKGAIFAALVAGTTFFVLRKNLKSGLLFLVVVVLLGGILVAVTPVQKYFVDYANSSNAETGTGRVGLWQEVIPAIMEKPLYGHGFATSKFIYEDVEDVGWPAGHTHNGFLEALYNNGVIGLAFLLGMLWITVRNLLWVIRKMQAGEIRTFAIGAFALFIFEILNGMLNASFGGRVGSSYLMLLSLFVTSEALAGLLQQTMLKAAAGQYEVVRR